MLNTSLVVDCGAVCLAPFRCKNLRRSRLQSNATRAEDSKRAPNGLESRQLHLESFNCQRMSRVKISLIACHQHETQSHISRLAASQLARNRSALHQRDAKRLIIPRSRVPSDKHSTTETIEIDQREKVSTLRARASFSHYSLAKVYFIFLARFIIIMKTYLFLEHSASCQMATARVCGADYARGFICIRA